MYVGGVHRERMDGVHVPRIAGGAHDFSRGADAVDEAAGCDELHRFRSQHAGDVVVGPHADSRRRVVRSELGKQREQQQRVRRPVTVQDPSDVGVLSSMCQPRSSAGGDTGKRTGMLPNEPRGRHPPTPQIAFNAEASTGLFTMSANGPTPVRSAE